MAPCGIAKLTAFPLQRYRATT